MINMALWRPIVLSVFLTWLLLLDPITGWPSTPVAIAQDDPETTSPSSWRPAPSEPHLEGAGAARLFLPLVAGVETRSPAQLSAKLIPGTVDVPAPIEAAVLQILSEGAGLPPGIEQFAITDLEPLNEWRFVSVAGLADVPDGHNWNLLDHGHWFGLILVQEQPDGNWIGALEGTTEFSNLLAQAAPQLADPLAVAGLDLRQGRAQLAESYILPWEPGTRMQYGGRGVHDNEFSAITPGWKAVDFLSDGNTALGRAPNRILAAASGAITYKCSPRAGENSTAIRVGNLMYTHLLNSASLTVGRTFAQRELLGSLKAGSFSEACGYASQGAAWFHLHWGFPNSGTFAAGGWTLNLTDQKWRRGTTVEGIGAWLLAEGIPAPPLLVSPGPGETVTTRTVELVWQSPNAPGQNGYSLRISQSANPETGPWLVDTSLANGQTGYTHTFTADGSFFWHLRTWNLAGQSSTWATQAFTIASAPVCPGSGNSCPPPDPPLLLSPAPDALFDEGQTFELAWQTSLHTDVYWGEISGEPLAAMSFGWTDTVSQSVNALAAGHTYTWRIRARNLVGESDWSEAREFTVRPAAPADLVAQPASCNQVNLLWVDLSAAEEAFVIYRDGAPLDQVSANTTHYQDAGLQPENSYTYTVTALAGGIESTTVAASAQTSACEIIPQVTTFASPTELVVLGGEVITTSYTLSATGSHAIEIEQYVVRFTLPDGATPLADPEGPFDAEIIIPAGGSVVWEAAIYLPPEVVVAARSTGATMLLLSVIFTGQDERGHSIFVEHEFPLLLETCGDLAEPNETREQATPMIDGVFHLGVICPVADRDLYQIAGAAGDIMVAEVEAANHGSLLDAIIELYDSSGEEPLSVVDDSDDSPDPRLVSELPADGMYFISVRSVAPLAAGAQYTYTLHVALDSEPPLAAIIQPVAAAWLHSSHQMIEVDADDETGVERVEFYFHEAGADEPLWNWLGVDTDGSDGWQWEWDTSKLPIDQEMEIQVVVYDRAGRSTVVTVAGLRIDRISPSGTFLINDGALHTTTPFVTLTLTVTDVGLGVDQMEIGEGELFNGQHWVSAAPTATWELSGEEGDKMLSVRWRDWSGNVSSVFTQSITLDTIAPTGSFTLVDNSLTEDGDVLLQLMVDEELAGVRMRLRTDDGEWSDWMPAVESLHWSLGAGASFLTVQFRDLAGNLSGFYEVAVGAATPASQVFLPLLQLGEPLASDEEIPPHRVHD
jgi:hypothetical protein